MAVVKNTFLPAAVYNRIPFIHDMEHTAKTHKDDLAYLTGLLDKHDIPRAVSIKLLHIHFHLEEGEIIALSEINASPYGKIPFLAPTKPEDPTKFRGCNYLVDGSGNLQAFEYTTVSGNVDLSDYPSFVSEFCTAIAQRGLQHKFGLAVKSGVSKNGTWTELDYPEKRATFLLPSQISVPESDHVQVQITRTQFSGKKRNQSSSENDVHQHSEHTHVPPPKGKSMQPIIDGVTTRGGLQLSGMPLEPGTAFHSVISALAAAV